MHYIEKKKKQNKTLYIYQKVQNGEQDTWDLALYWA